MRRVRFGLVFLLIAGTAPALLAQNEVWIGPPTYLHDDLTCTYCAENWPAVATDGNGTWVAMWHSSDSANTCRSFSRSTDNGETWSIDVDLNFGPFCSSRPTGLATDRAGNWVATWSEPTQDDVVVTTSSDNGASWSTPASPFRAGGSERSTVATDGAGTWLLVYSVYTNDNDFDLDVARSTNNGSTWKRLPFLNSDAGSDGSNDDDRHVQLASDGNGTWIATWTQYNGLQQQGTLRVSRSVDDGDSWSPVTILENTVIGREPAVGTDGQGTWIVTNWCPLFPISDMCAYRSEDDGLTWSTDQPIVGPISSTNSWVSLATNGLGSWVLIGTADPPAVSDWELFISNSNDNGLTWNPAHLIDLDTQRDRAPKVALDGSGNGVVVYVSFEPGTSFPIDVRGSQLKLMQFEILDPNPSLLSGAEVSTNSTVLAGDGGRPVTGVAADGVTRVLLRVTTPGVGNVEFRISDENNMEAGVGGLSAPGGVGTATTLSVPTVPVNDANAAFAVLVPPLTFSRSPADHPLTTRGINIEATFTPNGGGSQVTVTETLQLHRPPILLLHGLWANDGTFGWDLMQDPRFTVFTGDYRQTNASSFFVNRGYPFIATRNALEAVRDQGIAVTQVDAFGHSMGGILFRRWVSGAEFPYQRERNYNAGDLRSLVTVDSPHTGSPLANVLIGLSETPIIGNKAAENFLVLGACITCGAVASMQTDSPETLGMPAAMLPVHAIVGKGGSDMIQAGLENQLPYRLGAILQVLRFFGVLPEDIFPPGLQHDVIVGRISQEGGLSGEHIDVFGFESLIPPVFGVHFASIAREPPGNLRAIELLNTPVDDTVIFAPGFAAAEAANLPTPMPPTIQPQLEQTGGIQITAPTSGTMVLPGQSVSVTVEGFGGYTPATVLILSDHDAQFLDTAPFTEDLTVPVEAAGTLRIRAQALDAADSLAEATEVQLTVDLSGVTLQSISAGQQSLYLLPPALTQSIYVSGAYNDGVQRDLTADPATTFVSTDTAIATVDSNGNVTGHAVGQTQVDITHGAFATSIDVEVVAVPLNLTVSRTTLAWSSFADAVGYDLVRGELGTLRSSGGDFGAAPVECLADNEGSNSTDYTIDPGPGQGFWFLARAILPGSNQSYDVELEISNSQVGLRDAEIDGATGSCP